MSSDAPKPAFKSVEVNIFNQVYSLRTNREVEHIRRIAGLVDERMRLISGHTTAHDLAKIAIFAALNLADELSDTRDYYEREFQKLLAQVNTDSTSDDDGDAAAARHASEPEAHALESAATDNTQKSAERGSWFEDIFDAPESDTARERSERLSSRVSAKLQSLRQQPKQETSFSIEEE
ncbi:MAG TPA: cell division protein ZapA [Pyrinomonadaceae bacterium]|nr:cell division protein ZapA [Pyrinomonadaceae bacterium]